MLIVQTMQAIVKDVAMRDQAHVIKQEVTRLLEDVTRLKERSMDLRRHFDMANGDLEKLSVTADKISKRGVKIESLDLEEPVKAVAVEDKSRPRLISGS
jgi:DNA recombination protein RmuC